MSTVWPEILAWLPFTGALALGWSGRRLPTLPFLALTFCLGWWFALLGTSSVLLFLVCLGVAAILPLLPRTITPLKHVFLILACVYLGLEFVPDTARLLVASGVQTGPASVAFTYDIGFSKPLSFFLLLFALPGLLAPVHKPDPRLVGAALLLLAGLIALAFLTRVIRWEVSFPDWLPIFVVGNLLLTCLPEEAFFRGYLQRELAGRLGQWTAILITSALFGLAHFGGGPVLVAFSCLAAVAYGIAFQFGGGLRSAVLFHFGFNMVHLTLFTYPAAVG